ncbi:dTDP-4-dehydrorhamnose reductase [Enterococcus camelliae]|uniref:dTDP-4-dehydrorhamnose reductase n=1 Tax=Enterococcus camelliae TaxID=453959 RepID=A0ABW5TIK0_9ENTE
MILLTGGNGQLGTELRHLLDEQGKDYITTDSHEMDITDAAATMAKIKEIQPKVIYHCAAYTAVDKAEDEGKELDELVNVTGTENVAKAAEAVGATLVYISTDYVFDGTLKDGEYATDAPTNPLNEYGRTKLAGEKAVQRYMSKYYIIRTSWVFGKYGHNFVFTMQKLAQTHPTLTVVNDQYGRPTWTRTLAEFMTFATEEKIPYGIYHLSNDHACTWYEFAKEILKDTDVDVQPVTSDQFPQKAHRPQYSVMDLSKAKATGFVIPTWEEALKMMLASL